MRPPTRDTDPPPAPLTAARLAEHERLFESRAGTQAGDAGRELVAEVRRLQTVIANVAVVAPARRRSLKAARRG